MTDITNQFEKKINQLCAPDSRLLLAISGGVDSMVLLHLCSQLNNYIEVAHCNFMLRESANQEQQLVKQTCKTYAIPFHHISFDTKQYAIEHKLSTQMAARELRYQYFSSLLKKQKLTYLLTAHHLDDQIETVFLKLLRGSGIQGVSGILPKRDHLIRPLLFAQKHELYQYANANHLPFIEDESNQSNAYERNIIRNQILPSIAHYFPNYKTSMAQSINHLQFAAQLHRQQIEQLSNKLLHQDTETGSTFFLINELLSYPHASQIFFALIQPYQFTSSQSSDLFDKLLTAQTGAIFYSPSHQLVKDRKRILIAELSSNKESNQLHQLDNRINLSKGTLYQNQLSNIPKGFSECKNKIIVDASKLNYPLHLRHWLPGDYFYPLGLGKKQKLKRFFSNNKLSVIEKQTVNILCSGDKIVWIIGHRMDHRFRITSKTKQAIEFTWEKE